MWLRDHAPRNLGEVALGPANRRTFETYLSRREIPRDLILVGAPGLGKSTVAEILERALAFDAHVINASGRRGIDAVRGEISDRINAGTALARHLSRNPTGSYRIVRLEEAHMMTSEGLAALRTVMDERPDWVRLIFTCNELPGDEAVVDRCRPVIEFGRPPLEEQVRVVERILAAEGLAADPEIIMACAKASPTMRSLIGHAEQCFLELGRLEPPAQTRERRPVKKDTDLLLAVQAIISELGRPRGWPLERRRLSTRELLAQLKEEGRVLEEKELATKLGDFDVHPRTFTNPGEISARGYRLADVDRAVAKIANRGKQPR
jgi:hypothetical protein